MKKRHASALVVAGALVLGGCAYDAGGRDYRGYEVGAAQSVQFGVVDNVRDVRIDPHPTGVGAGGGAVLGAIAGSNVGGGTGQVAGAVGGAILGGLLGEHIEQSANERHGLEITVHLDSGRYVSIVQEADELFRPGDRVRVLRGRGRARVTH